MTDPEEMNDRHDAMLAVARETLEAVAERSRAAVLLACAVVIELTDDPEEREEAAALSDRLGPVPV